MLIQRSMRQTIHVQKSMVFLVSCSPDPTTNSESIIFPNSTGQIDQINKQNKTFKTYCKFEFINLELVVGSSEH